jgi:hypothetical protein
MASSMDWTDTVRELVKEAAASPEGLSGTRDALYCLWLAIRRAPDPVRDMFRSIDEDWLANEAARLDLASIFTDVPMAAGSTAESEALLRALAVRVRVLEELFLSMYDGAPLQTGADCVARGGGTSAYIVPRPPKSRAAKTGDYFLRRGLRDCRIIQSRIGDFDVELIFPEDPRSRLRAINETEFVVGAGLFENLKLVLETKNERFLVSDAVSPNQLEVIEAHLAAATKRACAAVVYPELTIGRTTLGEISRRLSNGTWDVPHLSILVAGSMHAADGGRTYNVATVFDGYGQTVVQHRKLYRFSKGATLIEDIDLGTKLHVVVLEDAIFTIGICLDFCNLMETPPYVELDVDFVVVPSYGTETTMVGHVERSTDVMKKLKCRTVVVQQFDEPVKPQPLGYVLARINENVPPLGDLATDLGWNILILYDVS